MGAWPYLGPRLRELVGERMRVRYIGRPERGSPAEGAPEVHMAEQTRLVQEAFGDVTPAPVRKREVVHAR